MGADAFVPNNTDIPENITVFVPAVKVSTAAVVIFPGGGYAMRAEHEGKGYAEFLNAHGITAFVVDYRVAPERFPLPLIDARYAVRYVRAHADDYGIDPDRVAVMGSSAGGHLAALTSTYSSALENEDMTDVSPFPNAQILCYPVICSPASGGSIAHAGSYENLIGARDEQMEKALDPSLLVTKATPRAFIWHTSSDDCVSVLNSYRYATALRENGVDVEMHIFPFGRHGLGLAAEEEPHAAQWGGLLINWLRYNGWISP